MSNKTQQGIALMTVIMFLFIMSLTWLSFPFISSYEADVLQKQVASERASYIAEAGIQQGLYFLSQDWNWKSWVDNKWGNGGMLITDGTLQYYQWSGNLGDSNQAYTVQIRNDGKIQSKIKVGSPDLNPPSRIIEVELGSAFDFGLYSHDQMKFSTGFTVSGTNSTGYAYAKNGITNPTFLTADKKVGNYSTAPWFLPKEIPLPELWKTKIVDSQTGTITWVGFEAKINGAPTSTTVRYNNDNGEDKLEKGALLHNKTRGNFRKISSTVDPNIGTNTITTETSTDNWAAGDKIVVERVEVYENFWNTLNQDLNLLNNGSYTSFHNSSYENQTQTFSDANFDYIPVVQFKGNTTFSGKIKIDGNAIFGRKYAADSGSTVISGDVMVKGNAYFFNKVTITGRLFVGGSLYMFDSSTYRGNELYKYDPYWEDWQEYLAVDSDSDNRLDFDTNNNRMLDTDEINFYIDDSESGPSVHGITIDVDTTDGDTEGVFVNGTASLYKDVSTGLLKITGYFYVNGSDIVKSYYDRGSGNLIADHYNNQVKIYHGDISGSWAGLTRIENGSTPETAFYVRNGNLEIGNVVTSPYYRLLYTDLQARGSILVAQNIILHRDLFRPAGDTNPLFLACGGNFTLSRYVKTNAGSPFYGLIHVGEEAKFGLSSTSGVTIGGGQIIANTFKSNTQTNPFYGTSITYRDYKTQLYNFGFTNNEDYSRPLLWRDTTE